MAKVSKIRKSKKRSKVAGSSSKKPPVVYDDEQEEDVCGAEEDVSSEEDDGEDERKRQKLLEAIGALGGKRKHALAERSEAAVHMSEFSMTADDEADLSDLIGTIEKTPAATAQTKKHLKNLQRSKNTVECPLSKQENERIQRDVAFQKAALEVSRWQSIITQNQRAEQLVFPLNQEPSGPKPIEQVVMGWEARTPLEKEIFSLLAANKQPILDAVLTPAEEASVKAMDLEQVKIRRAERQKARALQSYYEAKARRERKIKSKKYHKVQNKAKRKEFVKQFEELVKTDPAAALEELDKMERARMQERMSLKHQNSGKWAKSKAIMAKYDEGARKAMQQQLEVNKDLTQKLVTSLSKEEEEEEEGEGNTDMLPDFVNDAEFKQDSSNPWMRGRLSEDPTEMELKDTMDVTAEGASAVTKEAEEEEGSEAEGTEEDALLREFDSRRKQRQDQESDTSAVIVNDGDDGVEEDQVTEDKVAEISDEEEEGLSEFTRMYRGIGKSLEKDAGSKDGSAELEEGLMRIRSVDDVDLLPQETPTEPQQAPTPQHQKSAEQQPSRSRKRKKGIELREVLTKETKVIKVPLAPTVTDSEEKLDQRVLIEEAFAGDDVISDFAREKRKREDEGKPKVIDLTLPGWGEWGGLGLKPSKRKRRRFRIRTEVPPPRKDQHLPSVIISEKRNSAITPHQVSSLPFPFENPAQFESSIRTPLGRTWNTERTVKKMTKPRVVTQLGAIIEPMADEQLLKGKKKVSARRRSRNTKTRTQPAK
ncbi:U3 small nucleolar RNA-associated protein 14 homolog A [Nothobranchius furzeri]|uniref:U3 small nucleolar RNA-associated protein 14-like protein A-like n=1 Tax=Nothobranchius furzeri TaxID=105023 RepID=A0A9D2Y6N4_NOTFU|nr:U3 small nucleolar RNA-associated protein 14 homolog A [Nothobranchius furzeri]KAF7215204.1 U3 small nucleolar RNA-associated protein 14-like protein A-like [Nothobranchius furzeri]